jgi:thiol:disulfide interchange protein DsbD
MMRSLRLFVVLLLVAAGLPSVALGAPLGAPVTAPHVQVQLVAKQSSLATAGATEAGLYFKIEPGWHIYWKNAGDAGEPPKLNWTLPKGVTAGELAFAAPKRLPLGPLMDYGYEHEALFPARLTSDGTLKPGATAHLSAKASWLVCSDRCIPGNATLTLELPVSAASTTDSEAAALFTRFASAMPQPLPAAAQAAFQQTSDGFRLAVTTGRRESEAVFFPLEEDVIENAASQKLTATANGFTLELKKSPFATAAPGQLKGVIELAGGRAYEIAAAPGTIAAPVAAASSAAWGAALNAIALAFVGGLILNLMPCVFPVLFLKGLSLVNSGNEDRKKLRVHGLVYTAGIVVSFWVLVAALLGLRAAGAGLGWGFQFQSPVFLSLMAGLLFFLGLSLAGQFEIGLSMTSAGGSLARKQGLAGSFFTGVLAVIVATPCTAPFMGVAIGYALSAPAIVTFAIFTAIALGLAAPYVALTFQPAWTRLLPRPGAWMEVLKQAVSVPIFATVIWLSWVLAGSYGANLLAALLAGFVLLAIAGWFLGRWPAQRPATLVAGLFLLIVIALDAVAPAKLAIAPEAAASAGTSSAVWQPWSAEAVARAQAAGQPVFIDFSASWCLSCQVNERTALRSAAVEEAFAAHHVLLLKADWTRHDEAITQALTALGRSGVPTYALYVPGETSPRLLPEVLTPSLMLDALKPLPVAK